MALILVKKNIKDKQMSNNENILPDFSDFFLLMNDKNIYSRLVSVLLLKSI